MRPYDAYFARYALIPIATPFDSAIRLNNGVIENNEVPAGNVQRLYQLAVPVYFIVINALI